MATDSFDRAAEDPLASPWSTWRSAGMKIVTNGYAQAIGSTAGAYYSSSSEAYSEVTIHTTGAQRLFGPAIHCSGSGATANGYYFQISGGTATISRLDNNSGTTIATAGSQTDPVDGDVLRLTREGGNLKAYKNGTLISGLGTVSDSTYTSGSPGIKISATDTYIAEWTDGAGGGAAFKSAFAAGSNHFFH